MALRRATHVAWRRVGDETVLIHLKTKRIYVLNPSGGFFWQRLDGTRGSRELIDELTLEGSVPDDATQRVDSFFEALKEADLTETGNGSTGIQPDGNERYPLPSFVPPQLVWQEQLRNFGQSCGNLPAEGGPCTASPSF